MVAQVGRHVVHDGGQEGQHPLLLLRLVDDIQPRGGELSQQIQRPHRLDALFATGCDVTVEADSARAAEPGGSLQAASGNGGHGLHELGVYLLEVPGLFTVQAVAANTDHVLMQHAQRQQHRGRLQR